MPYSDTKSRKVRSRSWTKADERRYEAQQRRQLREDAKAEKERERKLAKMRGDGTLDAYLEMERQKEQAEQERQNQLVLKRAEKRDQTRLELSSDARLMAGSLQTEFAQAIGWRERYSQAEGDWLDDPVAAMTTGYGFGEEVRTSRGIKLQVHLCLDCSNSMYHNELAEVSKEAVKNLYLAMRMASQQLPDNSLVCNVWCWARDTDGKFVEHVTNDYNLGRTHDNPLGPLDSYWATFDGEDTYIAPLLASLEEWEATNGDAGACRLDIIVTDGVLEHPADAREGDRIQERRDGALQTVMLNFLPIEDWSDSRVPKRCVQYPATPDNLSALMRGVLGAWLVNLV